MKRGRRDERQVDRTDEDRPPAGTNQSADQADERVHG